MTTTTEEHYIKVAEHFGLSHRESAMTRRSFLRGLVATGALVAAPSGLFLPREPKIYQVAGVVSPTLTHIRFPDGREVTIRDFKEDDKYDTIVIPEAGARGQPTLPQVLRHGTALGTSMLAMYGMMLGLKLPE